MKDSARVRVPVGPRIPGFRRAEGFPFDWPVVIVSLIGPEHEVIRLFPDRRDHGPRFAVSVGPGTGFEATRQVDPTRPFTLNWTPESPEQGGAQLEVTDVETGELVYDSNPIFGAHTSAEIPANVLVAGRVYRSEISATRVEFADPSSVPTRTAISGSLTRIELRTTGGGGAPLSIASIESNPDGYLKLIVNCTPNQPLPVQRSERPSPDGRPWTPGHPPSPLRSSICPRRREVCRTIRPFSEPRPRGLPKSGGLCDGLPGFLLRAWRGEFMTRWSAGNWTTGFADT